METPTRQTGLHSRPGKLLRDGGRLKRIPWPARGSPACFGERSGRCPPATVRSRCGSDSGFCTVELLEACRRQRLEFCVSVAPDRGDVGPVVRQAECEVVAAGPGHESAEVAELAYTPGGWKYDHCG